MKSINIILFAIAIMAISSIQAFSQDRIVLKTGEEINGYIIEKSDKEIKYKIMNSVTSPIIVLKTRKVDRIVFSNGLEMTSKANVSQMNKRLGFSMGAMIGIAEEAGFYKFQTEYFISPELSLIANGLIESESGGGLTIGGKYLFNGYSPKRIKGYVGMELGTIFNDFTIMAPIGCQYIGKKGFDMKLGLNGYYSPLFKYSTVFAELSLGWRF